MTNKRRARRALIAAGALCVLVAAALVMALVVAPPYVIRYELAQRLHSRGIAATIGNVDANIFTGRISIDKIRGHGPNGSRFSIGHLAINIDYGPLFHKHIEIQRLALSDARVPVRRTAEQGLTVLGLALSSVSKSPSRISGWGLGIDHAKLANIRLVYREPAHDDRPGVDQRVAVSRAKAGRFASWAPGQSTPVSLHLAVNQGRLNLAGRISPLGPKHKAHLKLEAQQFPMAALAPLVRRAGWRQLGGLLHADDTLDFRYGKNHELYFDLEGQSVWRHARAVVRGGIHLASRRVAWNGKARIRLARGTGQSSHAVANGRFDLALLRVGHPGRFGLTQADTQWQGQARVELGAKSTQIRTHGDLAVNKTRLNWPGWLSMASAAESLHGDLDMTVNTKRPVISTSGRITTRSMALAVVNTVSLDTGTLAWNGKTSVALADDGTHIRDDGSVASDHLVLKVPKIMHVVTDHINWRGQMCMLSAALFSRVMAGRFSARGLHVEIPGVPTRMTADRFFFNGRYASTPNTDDSALRLSVSGSAASRRLSVINTAIHAPWLDALQAQAKGINIDRLDSIGVQKVSARGLRVLGNTNDTGNAVIQAVSMNAAQFSLQDMTHYSLHELTIDDAIIRARRSTSGMGAISQFFNAGAKHDHKSSANHSSKNSGPRSSFVIDHLDIQGPRLSFVDTSKTPAVRIIGHNLDFMLDHLDTGRPKQSADYRLALDIGAFGHLDSRGKIAPLASGGTNMTLSAWMRSLALAPFSGYLNAAMHRKIAEGAANGTLHLSVRHGKLDGTLKISIANLRLANNQTRTTQVIPGISIRTALVLLRGEDDLINFETGLQGELTEPDFSSNTLIRQAVLSGLRTALFSDFSPVGIANNLKNKFLTLFQSVEDYPAFFEPGRNYLRHESRRYMQLLAQAMVAHPGWTLQITGQAVPADAKQMGLGDTAASVRRLVLEQLAHERADAIRDYLAARGANPGQIVAGTPRVTDKAGARPAVTFSLDK